ncbi:hypothetical protein BU17DRAFT_88944 [Hysterangium stoloniferum]|nr:hypothetical protein BU17DRAFT_88944 [Hysterangium stoloniferum]
MSLFFSIHSEASNSINDLKNRGLLADLTTSHENLNKFLERQRVVYCGVDPTARSLHVGNLIPLLALLHLLLSGHQVIALLGGATALIGDPSGRDDERPMQLPEVVGGHSVGIDKQLHNFFETAQLYARKRSVARSTGSVTVLNNLDWWRSLSLVDFLHSTGKLVRISNMLSKESVKSRMSTSSGMSFSEFSYQLLQAYDFWHLYKHHTCSIQIGGSDQWGNIVAGLDLIVRREPDSVATEGGEAYGITTPLLTTSSGQKFGKSAGNAVWLDRQKTSVFDFYQFFMRTSDADVQRYLRIFTLLSLDEIEEIMQAHMSQPDLRSAQRKLAEEITEMIHGEIGVSQAQAATRLLFDTDLTDLQSEAAAEALCHDPRYHALSEAELIGMPLSKLAATSSLTRSRGDAVRLIQAGGFYLNNIPVRETDRKLQLDDLIDQRLAILRVGKDKHVVLVLK